MKDLPGLVGEVLAEVPHHRQGIHRRGGQDAGGRLEAEVWCGRMQKDQCLTCMITMIIAQNVQEQAAWADGSDGHTLHLPDL